MSRCCEDLDAPPENIEKRHISLETHYKEMVAEDLETSQDTDTRFCPHFHEGHATVAIS